MRRVTTRSAAGAAAAACAAALALAAPVPVDPPPSPAAGATAPADAADAYAAAVRRAQAADADVVLARDAAVRDAVAAKPCADAAEALDAAFQKYNDTRNAVLAQLEAADSRYKEMKGAVARVEADLARDPAAAPATYTDRCRALATFAAQVQQMEDDAVKLAKADGLRQQWEAASQRFVAAREKAVADAETSDRVKAAVAAAAAARAAVDAVRPAKADAAAERPTADDFARQFPRYGPTATDGGWTYGWSTAPAAAPPPPPPVGAGGK